MINKIKNIFRKEQFKPSFLSIIINSNFFVRSGIYKGIKENSSFMKGILLDFGCGTKPYRDLFNVEKYIGIDIKNSAHNNDISYVDVFYDGKMIPFDDKYFDSIYNSEVLTHIFDIEEIIIELHRVLKINGYILITVPFVWHENEKPNDAIRFTSHGICRLLEKHGFQIINYKKYGTYFTTVVQMWNSFLYHSLFPNSSIIKLILTILLIFPFQLVALIIYPIMPKNNDLFNTSVVVAKRIH